MQFPVRCMSCGKVISDKWEEFEERAQEGDEDKGEVLDDLGVEKYCCRTIFLTHVDTIDEVAEHKLT
ncbi:DNA-directed RNA polymerase subunit N [Candidatus Nanohalobium constans]|uniref:DNA-directed RNA polymerase subunit Rpo10 n=1 Tax=Candidatus Nanohalobium constans TaxID=2565781 RepID=A0A5Q0UJB3_9ARCH|nr:DNA-directed RNA polymerase subunit N [Candidatus Nanohalobium constans]QGA80919.1 DNA-directed RNA polymerase subunit N [Candidatus Nanohalobium constans]